MKKILSKVKWIIILATFFTYSDNLFSQDIKDIDSLNKFIQSELVKWNVPGATVAVVKDGAIIYSNGFGYRDLDTKIAADVNTLFAIGSLTKSFTASTIGILVDQKKLSWDSKLIDLLPDFKLKDEFATLRITPIDILCHRSGLPDHNMVWYVTDFDREDLVRRLRYLEPSFDFRTKFQYNPLMYNLAGYLVGIQSSSTWEAFTKSNIFEPLKMERSNFSFFDMIKDSNHAKPYIEKNGKIEEVPFHPSQHLSAAAGAINSTAREMANWLLLNLNDGVFAEKQIITKESLAMIHSPQITFAPYYDVGMGPEGAVYSFVSYGLGWIIGTYYDQIVLEHSGAIDGFSSKMTLLPSLNAGIVVLTNNQNSGDTFCNTVNAHITSVLMGREPFDLSSWFTEAINKQTNSNVTKKKEEKLKITSLRTLDEYAGAYENEGYGTIVITKDKGELQINYYRYHATMELLNYEVFKTVGGIINRKVIFNSDSKGNISNLAIQWDRSVNPIIFNKIN
jgi:CubicO group peptidase (beta-lactamase class C family)